MSERENELRSLAKMLNSKQENDRVFGWNIVKEQTLKNIELNYIAHFVNNPITRFHLRCRYDVGYNEINLSHFKGYI